MSENPFSSPEAVDVVPKSRGFSFLRVALLLGGCFGVLILLTIPNMGRGREAAYRTQCKSNLKHIALALHNYHDVYGSLPPAYTTDESGQPLHSWRTLILPFLEQTELYNSIGLSKPWNDPANKAARETSVSAFRCLSSDLPPHHTSYLGASGDAFVFYQHQARSFADITDGTSNTILVLEVPAPLSVPWMSPQDADEALLNTIRSSEQHNHQGGFQVTLADGSARFISRTIDEATFSALLTMAGDDVVGEF